MLTFLLVVILFFFLWGFLIIITIGASAAIKTRTDLIIWLAGTFLAALIATLLIFWGVIE